MPSRSVSRAVPKVRGPGFVVLDTETTGLHDPARVIEVALIFTSLKGDVQHTWSTLVHGDGSAGGSRLERIHGIRDQDLVGAPTFRDLQPALESAMADRIPIGHNAKFDRARLNYELRLLRKKELPELACTMYMGMRLGFGQLRLDDAIRQFGITRQRAHSAHDDALATADLLRHYISADHTGVQRYLRSKGFA